MLEAIKRIFSSTEKEAQEMQETVVLSDFGSLRLNLSNPKVIKRLIATYDSAVDQDLVEAQTALRHSEKPKGTDFAYFYVSPALTESPRQQG